MRKLLALAPLLALAFFALVASAGASPAFHDRGSGEDAASIREFWTPKRMREARELRVEQPATRAELEAAGLSELEVAAAEAAPAGSLEGGTVDPATSRAPRAPAELLLGPGSAPPYLSGEVDPSLLTTYPYSANGRLYGVFRRAGAYSCSATVIPSSSRSVALTAAHCLYDSQLGWARRVVFVPAYREGFAPFGSWTYIREAVPRGWIRGQRYDSDYGAVKLGSPSGPVGAVVGEEGFAWNQPREQVFQAIGYPVNRGNTQLMWNCLAGTAGVDDFSPSPGPPDTAIGCDMGGGSSGGGWTIRDAAGSPYVNGVTSYGYKQLKNVLFSPYLRAGALKTINLANRG